MAEYASKGGAYGTGITALALGATAFAGQLFNGNGIFGGLGGNGMNVQAQAYLTALAEKDKQIASLEAEKYSDSKDIQLYEQIQKELEKQQERTINFVQMEVSKNQEIGDLREKLTRAELGGQIAQVASQVQAVATAATTGIAQANNAIAGLQQAVQNITKVVVPMSAICPTPMPQYNSWVAPTTTATASAGS